MNDSPTGAVFTLGIIPETRAVTTIGTAAVGSTVNIEVDVMAKYVERLLSFRPEHAEPVKITGPTLINSAEYL